MFGGVCGGGGGTEIGEDLNSAPVWCIWKIGVESEEGSKKFWFWMVYLILTHFS